MFVHSYNLVMGTGVPALACLLTKNLMPAMPVPGAQRFTKRANAHLPVPANFEMGKCPSFARYRKILAQH